MTKHYCDICGKECTDKEFNIPIMHPYYGMKKDVIVMTTYKLFFDKVNLCVDCQRIIGGYVYDLKKRMKEINKEN